MRFLAIHKHNEKTRAMVSQIDHFDVIVVQSEFEALVLECALIKRHQPRYNRSWAAFSNRSSSAASSISAVSSSTTSSSRPSSRRTAWSERPCLNFHMGVCDGYCREEMDQSQYGRSIDQAVRLLEGRLDEVVDELTAT